MLQKTKSKWYGFIDLADITESIVQTFGQQKLETTDDFWEALAKDEMFIKKKVNDIMGTKISVFRGNNEISLSYIPPKPFPPCYQRILSFLCY